ncbi:hypothetical protein EVAR_45877_1 [Eumeta japonica]|uniref:Uncharacterized protein n=1 Tax=Eumeta variegata TaxID=151549 RepID=A0A4C1WPJ2_EUMVA|nr:hypothetical protein EVAR_45877_1 [Eumeta japonica]
MLSESAAARLLTISIRASRGGVRRNAPICMICNRRRRKPGPNLNSDISSSKFLLIYTICCGMRLYIYIILLASTTPDGYVTEGQAQAARDGGAAGDACRVNALMTNWNVVETRAPLAG